MNTDTLQTLVSQGLSTHEIAVALNCSQTNVRYWLRKFKLKTNYYSTETETEKFCSRCNSMVSKENFYTKRGRIALSTYCKSCTNNQTIERQRKLKEQAIQYKGGKCASCGYMKYQGALEFHHTDSAEKEFSIAKSKNTNFEKIKSELDKCILLCSNCHREVHAKLHEEN